MVLTCQVESRAREEGGGPDWRCGHAQGLRASGALRGMGRGRSAGWDRNMRFLGVSCLNHQGGECDHRSSTLPSSSPNLGCLAALLLPFLVLASLEVRLPHPR